LGCRGFLCKSPIQKTIDEKPLIKDLKSKKSKRFVKMPDWYMDELRNTIECEKKRN
jgi:hypothetical protein